MLENEKKKQKDNLIVAVVEDFLFYHNSEEVAKLKVTIRKIIDHVSITSFADDLEYRKEMHSCLMLMDSLSDMVDKIQHHLKC